MFKQIEGVKSVERGLIVTDGKALTDETLQDAFDFLFNVESDSIWAQLDLYAFCLEIRLDPFDYIDPTQISQATLNNRMVAWRTFPTPQSRRWRLSFTHYLVVSNRRLQHEDRVAIMDQAEQGGLSSDTVRELVKSYLGGQEEEIIRYNPVRMHRVFTTAFHRSRRIYEWASANGLPENLDKEFSEVMGEAKAELELLHASIEN